MGILRSVTVVIVIRAGGMALIYRVVGSSSEYGLRHNAASAIIGQFQSQQAQGVSHLPHRLQTPLPWWHMVTGWSPSEPIAN